MLYELEIAVGPKGPGLAVELGPVVHSVCIDKLILLLDDAGDACTACKNLIEIVELACLIIDTGLAGLKITDTAVVGRSLRIVLTV